MLPKARSSRRVFAGTALAACVLTAVLSLRGFSAPDISQPPPYRQRGSPDAPVLIVEFSDFQCPGCAAAVEPLKLIQTIYPGKIRVMFKHNPWPIHEHSKEAAQAAECAGQLAGKFWEYHDVLYSHQLDWARTSVPKELFLGYAKELRLDQGAFSACLDAAATAAVEADYQEGRRLWVMSTPTFFINGERFVGIKQLRTLGRNRIEDLLKK